MGKKQFSMTDSLKATRSAANEQNASVEAIPTKEQIKVPVTVTAAPAIGPVAVKRGPYKKKNVVATNEGAAKGRRGPKESTIMDGTRAERTVFLKSAVTPDTFVKMKTYCAAHQLTVEEFVYLATSEYMKNHK